MCGVVLTEQARKTYTEDRDVHDEDEIDPDACPKCGDFLWWSDAVLAWECESCGTLVEEPAKALLPAEQGKDGGG